MLLRNYGDALMRFMYDDAFDNEKGIIIATNGQTVLENKISGKNFFIGQPKVFRLMKYPAEANKFMTGTQYTSGLIFGTGNDPVSKNDYKLSGEIVNIASSQIMVNEISNEFTNEYKERTFEYTINNNTGAEITIGEVALCCYYSWGSSFTNGTFFNYLLERTPLEKPITIEAGGSGKITYSIKVYYPI